MSHSSPPDPGMDDGPEDPCSGLIAAVLMPAEAAAVVADELANMELPEGGCNWLSGGEPEGLLSPPSPPVLPLRLKLAPLC